MLQSTARIAYLFIGERKIVMRVGVCRGELQRDLVNLDRFLNASSFVENVTEVEISERISRVGIDRLAVVRLCLQIILARCSKACPD